MFSRLLLSIPLIQILLLFSHSDVAEPCLVVSVNSSRSLQQALNFATTQTNLSCINIDIPSGNHSITSQSRFHSTINEIEITGTGEWARITCDYSNIASNYTWYFAGLRSVTLTGIRIENCPRPLGIDTVEEVVINNCTFSLFREAVLDVFNCHHILFNNNILEHNYGNSIGNESYRGNTGGVSFGYNTLPINFSSPNLHVSRSVFRNNSAFATTAFRTSSNAFFAQIFTGRGGSMAVFVNESRHNIHVLVENCTFENNYARSFGGGAYFLLGGFGTSHKIDVERAIVRSNIGLLGGGGFQVSFFNNGPEEDPLLMRFNKCRFESNVGIAGGGMFVFTSTDGGVGNLVQIRSTNFTRNQGYQGDSRDYGAAVALSLLNPLVERSNFPRHEITDCTFFNNTGANGVVSVGYSPMNFTGLNVFSQNNGTALRVVGAIVYLSGELHFINNTAGNNDESALYMLSFGQAILSRGLLINFQGNTGRFGASISIESTTTSTVYTQLAGNPQCPFIHQDFGTIPQHWSDVRVRFSENRAILGSAIYVSRLDTCSWFSNSPPFFNNTFLVDWPIWEIDSSNEDTGYTEEEQSNATLSVQTQVNTLVVTNSTIRAWPGQKLVIGVSGWDEFNHTTTATAGFNYTPLNATSTTEFPEIRFIPEVVVVGPDPTTGLLTTYFTVYYGMGNISLNSSSSSSSTSSSSSFDSIEYLEDGVDHYGIVRVYDPILTQPAESGEFLLKIEGCPAGYVLRPHATQTGISVCVCNEQIADLLLCVDDQKSLVIRRGQWAVYAPTSPQSNLRFYSCPPGYCRCHHDNSVTNETCIYSYLNSDPNTQCACSRYGTLCGECRHEGEGVSALLNNCVSCNNASGLLILLLIVLDAVVMAILVLLDRPLPDWVYPFVFYIQLGPILALDFPDSFIKIGKYLYFFASGTGFYFIYDFCLYGNTSSQVAYFLRYIPLLVGILVCTPLIIGRSYVYRRFLRRKPLQHHGLWLVVLLTYSHLVHTSMNILNCPSVIGKDGSSNPRWYVNGEVECFTGGHIAIGLLAILVLLASLLLTPLIVLISIGRLKKYGMEFLQPPLVEVFRDQYRWWAGLELGQRFLLLLFTVSLPRNDVVKVLILAVYTTVYSYIQPYKSRLANYIQISINLNFLLLLLINATSFFRDDFFVFPSLYDVSERPSEGGAECKTVRGIAVVSWILMPFYYLPVLVGGVTAAVLLTVFIFKRRDWTWRVRKGGDKDLTSDVYNAYNSRTKPARPEVTTTVFIPEELTQSTEGYLKVTTTRGKRSRRGITSLLNRSSFFRGASPPPTIISNSPS